MAIIGNIDIGLSVNTKKLKSGLDKAAAMVGAFASHLTAAVTSPLALFGVGLSGAGLVAFTRHALEAVDATDELAQRVGTTAGTLNTLRYQAQLTGSEASSMDGALMKMTRTLGAAANGSPIATKAIKQLGLDARQLATMDPGEAFQRIATAISQIPNPAQQAAAAMQIFGRGGMAIMNTLRAGPERMKQLADEARRLGLAIDPADVERISAANDAMDKLGFAVQGVGITLATNVAPAVTQALEGFVRWATEGNRLSNIITAGFDMVRDSIIFARAVLENWEPIFEIIELKVGEFVANGMAYFNAFATNIGIIFETIRDNWFSMLGDMVKHLASVMDVLAGSWTSFFLFLKDLMSGTDVMAAATKLAENLTRPIREAVPAAMRDAVGRFVAPELVDYTNLVGDAQQRLERGLSDSLNRMGFGLRGGGGEGPEKRGPTGLAPEKMAPPKFAQLAVEGTKEAYASIVRYRFGGRGEGIDLLVDNSNRQTDLQERMADALEGMDEDETDVYSMGG